ncbi:MAG: hypothetical protein KJ666_01110 [Bacteroidetes bacterium]|nr:hypothetical protein [Bacteroidota bacterium]MBU2585208.1 hypothetical protein [Bacteroidota bacterium]
MKILGTFLLFLGIAWFIFGFTMKSTIKTTEQEFIGITYGGSEVHNIGLLNEKQNMVIISGSIFLASAVFSAASFMVEEMKKKGE